MAIELKNIYIIGNAKDGINAPADADLFIENAEISDNGGSGIVIRDKDQIVNFLGITDPSELAIIKEGILEILALKKEDRETAVKQPNFINKYGGKVKDAVAFTANILKIVDSPGLHSVLGIDK